MQSIFKAAILACLFALLSTPAFAQVAPVLDPIGNQAVDEGVLLSFTATATDADDPAQTLTFTLDGGAPAGAGITTGGVFTWTPTEADGPGNFDVTIRVTDSGTPNLDDFETITVTVNEVNVAPVLDPIGDQTVEQESLLTFTATATDTDVPANSLTFSLDGGAPAGASITSGGVFTWTPTTIQGPGDFLITVRVTDDGTPNLDDFETITVTISEEPNVAPVLNPIGNRTVDELTLLTFTATATDANDPAQTLTFTLDGGAPAGAGITTGGVFTWTPTEADGPGNFDVTIRVTDSGTPNLDDFETITVTVNEVNVAPVLDPIGDQTVEQESLLTFTATATDTDVPANSLTFSLDGGAPAGASITSGGVFTWTPTTIQGPGDFLITVRVTDDGTPNLDDFETITVTISEEPNVAPVLDPIGNRTVDELTLLTFTATATDANDPAQTLTFTLDGGAPAGASITTGGVFTWTPTEADGPGNFDVTIRVTDSGTPNLDDFETITVTVNEVNVAPVLDPIGDQTVEQESLLTFTATATDTDVPANSLTFSLDGGAPAGASITSGGVFTWTPTTIQGPGDFLITVRVTDDGTPNLDDFETITVTISEEPNVAPVLDPIGNRTVDELTLLTFTATATDANDPAQTLTFTLDGGAPAGASITTGGVFTWTPTEADGPGNFDVTIRVTDSGTPNLDDFETITVTVNEVNVAPVLDPIGDQTVEQESLLTFTATATDTDVPANSLTFSLDGGAPAGASITSGGVFTWTPTTIQGPGDFLITVRVTDDGTPNLDDFETITVTISEEPNVAPVLDPIGNRTVDELTLLTFTATATDANDPAQTLTFTLDGGAPAGAGITTGGVFTWTPTEADGPGNFDVTIRVTDSGTPNLDDFETITVTVNEVNVAPVLDPIGDQTVEQESLLTFTATATDTDVPANSLTFSLDGGAPAGASITSGGVFTWTPTTIQGPGDFLITVRVTDDGTPNLDDFETITVTISEEPNVAPVLDPIGNRTVDELTLLTFTATATDANDPAQTLTFTLDGGAPAGASITTGGVFTWTPTEADGPGNFDVTIRVTDSGTPNLDDFETITVTVNEVNVAPVLDPIGDQTVEQESLLTFTATATDTDVPANSLTFSLDGGAPAGASITSGGVFTWTPTTIQGPGDFLITVRVTDDGTPNLDDFETITVTISEEPNVAPVLDPIGNRTVDELTLLTFTATATDANDPAQTLTFTLDGGAPAGAGITTGGVFTWTPTEADGPGNFDVTIRVTDSGTPNLDDFETITVTVNEVNVAPVLDPIGDQTVEQESLLTFTATATDTDVPANSLTFSLDGGAPAGASITSGGVFTWTPTTIQGPGDFLITVRVTDDGTPNLDDFETITVTISEEPNVAPVLDPIGNRTVDELTLLTFTATATDANDPAQTLTFTLDGGAPAGAGITTGGVFTWTPTEADGPGNFDVTIRVTDSGTPNLDDFETITVTVNDVNVAPTANPQTVSTDEDTPIGILLTGSDPDGDTLSFGIATQPTLGVLSGTPPNILYTPNAGVSGQDSFTFTVSDAEITSAAATVTIDIAPINDAPTADPQSLITDEDVPLPITLTGTDPDTDPLNFLVATQPINGVLAGTPPNLTYTPNLDYNGPDSFTFTVDDGTLTSSPATISITVTPVNDAPVANNDDFDVTEGQSTVAGLNVLANDTDPDVTPPVLTANILTAPTLDPAFVLNSDGTFSYTHDGSETLSDSFSYEACDNALPSLCSAAATVTISVDNVNDAPVIEDQLPLSTAEETALLITLVDLVITDVDSDPSTFVLSVQDDFGYVRSGNTITPSLDFNGDLTVPVIVNDGEDDSAVFDLLVTVTPINDQPVITGQAALSTPEDTSLTITVGDLVVVDPDNVFPDDFVLQLQDGTDYTRVENTITPTSNFNGLLSVAATVSDGVLSSNVFMLIVDVSAENDEPVVVAPVDPQLIVEGSAFSLSVAANFMDADGDALTYTASGLPASGNLTFNPQTGVFDGKPNIDDTRDNDPYIIVVTADDGQPGSTPAQTQFELNISALDRANVALDISVTPDPAMLGDELRWTMTVSNAQGPQGASNVEVTGSFVGAGLIVSSDNGCTIQAEVSNKTDFDCAIGSVPVGGSVSITFTTTTTVSGDVVAFGSAANADPVPIDPNTSDNSVQQAVGVAEAFSNGVVQVLGLANVRSVAAGDVDGDGVADLVVGTAAGQPLQIYLSGGFRDFVTSPIVIADSAAHTGLGLADFDGNGALDIVVATDGGRDDRVYGNDGFANFTPLATLGATFAQGVAVGDFDADGIPDIAVATTLGNPVYLGDGNGQFSLHATLGSAVSNGVAAARLSADARDDLVFANAGSNSQVWIKNSGTGFSQGASLPIGDAAAVTIGEFGGNGQPDLAFARVPSNAEDVPANPVLLNDGSGGFPTISSLLGTSATSDIHAGDVNRDGLADLVFVNSSGMHQVWTATGGGFVLWREQIVDTDSTVGVLTDLGMTDVGEPGGVDLAIGGASVAGLGIYLNDGFGNLGMGDAVAPVLTLVGSSTVDVPSGTAYSDAGATADDNIDGDISRSIVATSSVNTSVVGDYTVTYNVFDRAGNAATPVTRRVTVTPAAGTGGGGGVISYFMLLLLIVFVKMQLYRAEQDSLYGHLLRSGPRDN